LPELTVPESVQTLGGSVFNECVAMTDIYLYNPYCDAPDADATMLAKTTTIHSHSDSAIEAFADEFGFNFEEMHIPGSEWVSTATCVDAGIRYHECKYCDEKLDTEEAAATGHDYEDTVTTPATCNAKGEKTFTCSVCEDSYTEEIAFDADNHVGETEIRNDKVETCGVAGYTGDTYCLSCENVIEEGTEIPATGEHDYVETVTTPATCIAEGEKTSACSVCGNTFKDDVPVDPENHAGATEVRDIKEATCVDAGYTGNTYCVDCGEKIADGEDVPATGEHIYVKANTKKANCHEKGEWTYICSTCSDFYIETIEIDSTNHDGGEDIRDAKDATCADAGYTGDRFCMGCNAELEKGEVIPATGDHDYVDTVTTPATCNATGVKTFTCSVCEDSYTEEIAIDADNHVGETEIRDVVAETCGAAGYTGDKYCLDCENIIEEGSEIPATGNHDNTSEVTKIATCCETGTKTYTCSVCGNIETEEIAIDAENHVGGTDIRDAAAENCGVAGYTGDTYCLGCDVTLEKGAVIPATNNHNYVSAVTKPANCYETGVVTYICSTCSKFYTESIEINKFNHAGGLGIRNDFEPTCAATGYTGDTYCLGCNETLKPGTVIEATGIHTYEDKVTTAPTCIEKGVRTFTCSVCEDSYTEEIAIDADNHAGETEIRDYTEETCGKEGYTGDTYCLDCEKKIADGGIIPATGNHTYESEVTTAPTCCATGVRTYTCTVCSEAYTRVIEIDATNHTGGTEIRDVVAETCGTKGYTGNTYCKGCDAKLAEGDEINATGDHTYTGVVTKVSTCTETGITTYTCDVCADTYDETIEKNADNHAGETEIRDDKAETCGVAGYTGDTYCLDCENIIENGKEIPATGDHTYEIEVTKAATCCEKGVRTYTCSECGYIASEEIEPDADNHVGETEVRNAVDETCITMGYTGDTHCKSCDAILETGTKIPATGKHVYKSEITKTATCCEEGVRTYTCLVCSDTFNDSIAKNAENHAGETEVRNAKEATCSATGYTGDTYCKDCGAKLAEGTEVAKTAHTEVKVEGKAATCSATGLTDGTKCSVCSAVITAQKTISKIDHRYGEWAVVKEPTVSEEGAEERVCEACGKKDTRSIEKLSYIIGDVNGDGKITAADARLALRISAKLDTLESVGAILEVVDVTLDKQITAADARVILRKSANLE